MLHKGVVAEEVVEAVDGVVPLALVAVVVDEVSNFKLIHKYELLPPPPQKKKKTTNPTAMI